VRLPPLLRRANRVLRASGGPHKTQEREGEDESVVVWVAHEGLLGFRRERGDRGGELAQYGKADRGLQATSVERRRNGSLRPTRSATELTVRVFDLRPWEAPAGDHFGGGGAFFNRRLGASRTLLQLLSLRRQYERSFACLIRCLPILMRLHLRTARDNGLPRAA
jgi:hypothetical protein